MLYNVVFVSAIQQIESAMCMCSVTNLCLTICDPKDCNLAGSSGHGISQARILEWVAISYFRRSSQPRGLKLRLLCFLRRQVDSITVPLGKPYVAWRQLLFGH